MKKAKVATYAGENLIVTPDGIKIRIPVNIVERPLPGSEIAYVTSPDGVNRIVIGDKK